MYAYQKWLGTYQSMPEFKGLCIPVKPVFQIADVFSGPYSVRTRSHSVMSPHMSLAMKNHL